MAGFRVNTDKYYVVVNHIKSSCIITTSKRSIALFAGISERTVYNNIGKGVDYVGKNYSIFCNPEVVKRPTNNPLFKA